MRFSSLGGSRSDHARRNGDTQQRTSVHDDSVPTIDDLSTMSQTLEIAADDTSPSNAQYKRQRRSRRVASPSTAALCLLVAGSLPLAMAQSCISLANSRTCPAFNASSVATSGLVAGLYPFLTGVNSVESFDNALDVYIATSYTLTKYQTLIGCSNVQLGNTTAFYARYTSSVICNAIVQNSISDCGLSGSATRPLCADSCAAYAQSEQRIVASDVCGNAGSNALTQIRADFTNCALPANSLTGSCIQAVSNQPDNCGFNSNLGGLCSYCSSSSPNATDSCCVFSDTTSRCQGVVLPVVATASLQAVTVTATTSTTATVTPYGSNFDSSTPGLTRGQVAGIAIGSILGAFFLLFLIIAGCLLLKRRRDNSPATSIFNQPASGRVPSQMSEMSYRDGAGDAERAGVALFPGGRVARMAALEGSNASDHGDPYVLGSYSKSISDDGLEDRHGDHLAALGPPPQRSGSLTSSSHLDPVSRGGLTSSSSNDQSPNGSNNYYSSPESRQQSEQLDFFKDYYSNDSIHPGDQVATLWAYEPRAQDEFHLERGDVVKVIGIWDDGWATGVRVRGMRAEDWRPEEKIQRDSGLSGATRPNTTATNMTDDGDVKAFPLVCVCLPQHWRKTIEGDTTESSGGAVDPF